MTNPGAPASPSPSPSAPVPSTAPHPAGWSPPPPPGAAFRDGSTRVLTRAPGRLTVALRSFWGEHARMLSPGTLAACAVVGVAAGALLVGHRLGLGAALVGLLVWVPALPVLLRRRAVGDLITAALSIALVAVVAVRDAGWVVALCLVVAAGAGAVAATSARSAPAVLLSVLSWAAGVARTIRSVLHGAGSLVGPRRAQVITALRSVAVTVALLAVFGLLFASADQVFASYLPVVELNLLPAQAAAGVLVALAATSVAHLALTPPGWSDAGVRPGRPARLGEWLLPVLALDAMVFAFVLVQVGALIGGNRYVQATADLTYAEYARQGFAQLIVATALTLAVVAVAARRAPRTTERDRLISRIALGALCVGTLGVVASALRRMGLYIDAFGLTRLRLLVGVVEVVLAVILVLVIVAGVKWRANWLPRAVVQVVAVAMIGLAAVNPDAQIVRYNASAEFGSALDVGYLRGLSADAVPAMDRLDEPLRSCLLSGAQVTESETWADWNAGRNRAEGVLEAGFPRNAAESRNAPRRC